VSIGPLDWICPLLAVDAKAFNHGGTPEFAAMSAFAQHDDDTPDRFELTDRRNPSGDPDRDDARPWCRGFYAAMRLGMVAWVPDRCQR